MEFNYKLLKNNVYLIIPICCFIFWAFLSLMKDDFILDGVDYPAFYYSSRYIFTNPELVYTTPIGSLFRYLPSFATVFSLMTLIPFDFSQWVMFSLLLLFGIGSVILFDKILLLKNVESIPIRCLFLIIISNGLLIVQTFDYLQTKLIFLFLILLFLEREIKFRKTNNMEETNWRFLFAQFMILLFAISMIPYLAFFIVIYLVQGINIRNIFNKVQIKKYLLCLGTAFFQNIMFIIAPVLISGFLSGFFTGYRTYPQNLTISEILADEIILPIDSLSNFIIVGNLNSFYTIFATISLGLMISLTLFLSLLVKVGIEKKFGLFIFYSFFFNLYLRPNVLVAILPLVLLLFILPVQKGQKLYGLIKNNWKMILGMLLIAILYFLPPLYFLFREFPITQEMPLGTLLFIQTYIYVLIFLALFLIKKENKISSVNDININNFD